MKNKDRISILIRLNLSKPDHVKVSEKLRHSNRSYTDEIVAQFTQEERNDHEALQTIIEESIRKTIQQCMGDTSLVVASSAPSTLPLDEHIIGWLSKAREGMRTKAQTIFSNITRLLQSREAQNTATEHIRERLRPSLRTLLAAFSKKTDVRDNAVSHQHRKNIISQNKQNER